MEIYVPVFVLIGVCVLFALLVFLLFLFVFDEFNKQFDNINKEERPTIKSQWVNEKDFCIFEEFLYITKRLAKSKFFENM